MRRPEQQDARGPLLRRLLRWLDEREDWIEHDGDAPCIAGETVSRCGGHGATGGENFEVQEHAGVCQGRRMNEGGEMQGFNLPLCGGCAAGGSGGGRARCTARRPSAFNG